MTMRRIDMKHEIVELHDLQIIGMAKQIAFNDAKEECPKFWGEFVEKIISVGKLTSVYAARTPLLTSSAVFIKVAKCPQECSSSPFKAGSG
jgi:hypothetical protein